MEKNIHVYHCLSHSPVFKDSRRTSEENVLNFYLLHLSSFTICSFPFLISVSKELVLHSPYHSIVSGVWSHPIIFWFKYLLFPLIPSLYKQTHLCWEDEEVPCFHWVRVGEQVTMWSLLIAWWPYSAFADSDGHVAFNYSRAVVV